MGEDCKLRLDTEVEVETSERKLELRFWNIRVLQPLKQTCSEGVFASPVRRSLIASESQWGREEGPRAVG